MGRQHRDSGKRNLGEFQTGVFPLLYAHSPERQGRRRRSALPNDLHLRLKQSGPVRGIERILFGIVSGRIHSVSIGSTSVPQEFGKPTHYLTPYQCASPVVITAFPIPANPAPQIT
jgi:hypothetical protein